MLIHIIKNIKNEKKLTYRELGKELGFSGNWLCEVVQGKYPPSINLLRAIHLYTGKSYDFLMETYSKPTEGGKINIEVLRRLFERSKKNNRHIRLHREKPSLTEKNVIDEIRKTTDFDFNQVTLNFNNLLKPHAHKNQGKSLAILLGDFEGGELILENGMVFSEKNIWFEFSGKIKHWVAPFRGDRYSIILYQK